MKPVESVGRKGPARPPHRRVPWARRIISTSVLLLLLVGLGYGLFVLGRMVVGMLSDQHASISQADLAPPVEVPSCDPNAVGLSVSVDPQPQGVGEPVDVTVEVTNVGAVPCSLDSSVVDIVLAAGEQTIWTPSACSATWDVPLLLDVGQSWVGSVVWSGHTYVGCERATVDGGSSQVSPGQGTFPLTVRFGDSKPTTSFVEVR